MKSQETLGAVDPVSTEKLQPIDSTHAANFSLMSRIVGHWSEWWRAFLTHRAEKRTADSLSTLSPRILQDIGGPESLLRDSNAIRQLEQSYDEARLWS